VAAPGGTLHVSDHPGAAPAIVMMHGFPDDSRIYDRIIPLLMPHRAVAYDWLGYGRSDRTDTARFTSAGHQAELGAVLDALRTESAVLVGHDASGPDAISYTLRHPQRLAHLVLLNTHYGNASVLRFPEMIQLLADHRLAPLADAILGDPDQRLWLLMHTRKRWSKQPVDLPASETCVSSGRAGVSVTSGHATSGRLQPLAPGPVTAWRADHCPAAIGFPAQNAMFCVTAHRPPPDLRPAPRRLLARRMSAAPSPSVTAAGVPPVPD